MLIPAQGRTVIVKGVHANGVDEAPAVITRAWDPVDTNDQPSRVNLTIFPDLELPFTRGSVLLVRDRQAAQEAMLTEHGPVAFWPGRA